MSIKIEGFPPSTAGITGALVYRGTLDPSSPPANITSAKKGDYYVVTANGTLATVELKDGDHILFNQDASNPLTASMFDKIDNTEPTASETVAGIIAIATDTEAGDATANNKALVPSNIGSIKTSDLNNDAGFITSALQSGDNISELVNDAGYLTSVSSASTTVEGIIEIATNAEATAGAENNKALVPSNIAHIDLSQLDEISYTAGAGIDGKFLKYVNANNQWEASDIPATASASETVAGIIAIATDTEAGNATVNNKALVPSNIGSIKTSDLNNDAGFITSYTETDTLNDVVSRGATTATSITTGGLEVSGDITADANASRTIGEEATRFITYYGDMNGAIRFKAKNDSGGAISKGEAVYIKGISGTVPTVDKARANSSATMPAFGLAFANANDQAELQVITFGNLEGLDTSSFSAGDTVFISSATAGALVNSSPTGEANLIQNIGKVLRSHATDGIIKVGGAGRTNATPNLNQDKIFLGNASNQAVPTALSSVNLSSFNNDSGFITSVASASETVEGIIEIATDTEATAGSANNKALVPSNIAHIDLSQLDEISYTAGAGIDGKFLKYVDANNQWEASDIPATASASETVEGIIEIATDPEATAGSANNKALVPSNISSIKLNQLDEVSYTAGSSINNYVLTYIDANDQWEAKASTGGGGGSRPTVTSITASDYNISNVTDSSILEEIYFCDTGASTVTLPTASSVSGLKIQIKNRISSAITIDTVSSQTIDTSSSVSITSENESLTFVSDGSNWNII